MGLQKTEGVKSVSHRQYNLDLLKAVAIICMLFCHPVFRFGPYISGYKNDFLFFFGEDILGAYLVAAHGFMFAMGVGIIYSGKGSAALIRRGNKDLDPWICTQLLPIWDMGFGIWPDHR